MATLDEIKGSPAYKTAESTWITSKSTRPKLSKDVVSSLYKDLLSDNSTLVLASLDYSRYLELYLWPLFDAKASNEHVVSIAIFSSAHRGSSVVGLFEADQDKFAVLFERVLTISGDSSIDHTARSTLLFFLGMLFNHIDSPAVRKEVGPIISISIWEGLDEKRRDVIFAEYPSTKRSWKIANKKLASASEEARSSLILRRSWLSSILTETARLVNSGVSTSTLVFILRSLEVLIAIVTQLPTRRFANTLIQDSFVLVALRSSPLYSSSRPFHDLVDALDLYVCFPIDDFTGEALNEDAQWAKHSSLVKLLQKTAFTQFHDTLRILALANFDSICNPADMDEHLSVLADGELRQLASSLHIRIPSPFDRNFLVKCFCEKYAQRKSLRSIALEYDVFPDEHDLFDSPSLDGSTLHNNGGKLPALSSHLTSTYRMGLQYLTFGDFVLRSFVLTRSELLFQIKRDIEAVVTRIRPHMALPQKRRWPGDDNKADTHDEPEALELRFEGLSRMAAKVVSTPVVLDVAPPAVGTSFPAYVRIEVSLDLDRSQGDVLQDWESLHPGDVVYLCQLVTPVSGAKINSEKVGIKRLRCAEVVRVLDEKDREINPQGGDASGRKRKLHLDLDSRRYPTDGSSSIASYNAVIRRRQRENNFKSILSTTQGLSSEDNSLPEWLVDVFLGFGDPSSASYGKVSLPCPPSMNYYDTFVDVKHVQETLPDVRVIDGNVNTTRDTQFLIDEQTLRTIEPLSFTTTARRNKVRFSPKQVEAIIHGVHPGLSLVVGPPGTGKTDVAAQTLSVLYHNFPNERTLVVAHSNQALNHIFEKLVALDISEKHLLRLGHGEETLDKLTDSSFSQFGRVEHLMQARIPILGKVDRLAASLGISGDHGDSSETAGYFFTVHIEPVWNNYIASVETGESSVEDFPFKQFVSEELDFEKALQAADAQSHLAVAKKLFSHVEGIFKDLADIRPFELLPSNKEKANFLLVHEARIIAMTATYAAMHRQDILQLGFKYDNVVMEEAAQLTEVETVVPLTMQKTSERLKRVVLIGDHHQNGPVIHNALVEQQCNLGQSLFERLVRLGVPHTQLNAQGRARPEIAELYSWVYGGLTPLATVEQRSNSHSINPGFLKTWQFVEVPAVRGPGESEPSPHFFQNVDEAEYAVCLYQYMRLLGYPRDKITILSAYHGQKLLIDEILSKRCNGNEHDKAIFGLPGSVATIDQAQGEQNDYVILSLVRTASIGYLRDLRRLTVALSRAGLGLYVLGRAELLSSCVQLEGLTKRLLASEQDHNLAVVPRELYGKAPVNPRQPVAMVSLAHFGQYVDQMTAQRVAYEKRAK